MRFLLSSEQQAEQWARVVYLRLADEKGKDTYIFYLIPNSSNTDSFLQAKAQQGLFDTQIASVSRLVIRASDCVSEHQRDPTPSLVLDAFPGKVSRANSMCKLPTRTSPCETRLDEIERDD